MAEDYIRAGFLCELLEPWVRIEGSEWGHQLECMLSLAEACLGTADERAVIVVGWIMDDLNRAFEAEWWGDFDEYLPQIVKARDNYPKVVEEWRIRSASFDLPPSKLVPNGVNASGTYEEVLALLPEWMKPADEETRKRAKLSDLEYKKYRIELDLERVNKEITDLG